MVKTPKASLTRIHILDKPWDKAFALPWGMGTVYDPGTCTTFGIVYC